MQEQTKRAIDRQYKNQLAPYVWCKNKKRCYDGKSTQANWARNSNGCDAPGGSEELCNGVIKESGRLAATRYINPGEEILIRYGDDYWRPSKRSKSKNSR